MELTEVLANLRNHSRNAAASGAPRQWFSIRNVAADEAEIFVYDYIGFDPFFGGVSALEFVRDLRAINARRILLRINSPGGDCSEAVAIRNALIEHPATIETHVDGLAASAASWVGLAAEKVIMSPHAMMMIHEPWYVCAGDANFLHKQADILDKFGGDIAEMYQEKGGGSVDDWRAKMREETWYTDQEAVAAGLADEIAGAPAEDAQNRYDPAILAIFKNTPPHLSGNADKTAAGEPQPAPKPAADRPEELVRAAVAYQRDRGRRERAGVAP